MSPAGRGQARAWVAASAVMLLLAARPALAAAADPQSPARVNTRAEPHVQQRVLEDEHIIIEELRVRGQPVRISVRGKASGARGYEVNVGPGGRDPSQDSGRAGQSAWRLLSF